MLPAKVMVRCVWDLKRNWLGEKDILSEWCSTVRMYRDIPEWLIEKEMLILLFILNLNTNNLAIWLLTFINFIRIIYSKIISKWF